MIVYLFLCLYFFVSFLKLGIFRPNKLHRYEQKGKDLKVIQKLTLGERGGGGGGGRLIPRVY